MKEFFGGVNLLSEGVRKPTLYGGEMGLGLDAGVGMTPCERKCFFALDECPKNRVQPGNPHR